MMNTSITERAMLVTLSISFWNARKFDRRITREVAEAHDTTEEVGRYNKNLLPRRGRTSIEAELYYAVIMAMNAARAKHIEETLPWSDDGTRILIGSNYLHYTEVIRKARSTFNNAVEAFLSVYPAAKAKAEETLKGGLYNERDYPSENEMPDRFSFSVKVLPLPSGDDFRVNLNREEVAIIQKQIEQDTKSAIAEAMRDPYRRLHEVVRKMIKSTARPKGRKFDNLIANIEEVCSILPRLNLTGDPNLERKQ